MATLSSRIRFRSITFFFTTWYCFLGCCFQMHAETLVVPPLPEASLAKKKIGSVAFTFDCAQWGDAGLDHILGVLKQRQIRATFFVTGKFIETNPIGILKIAEAGQEVANHSYEHDRTNSIAECNRVADLYHTATGKTMSRFFRAPYLHEKGIKWGEYAKNGWEDGYVSLITCDCLPQYKKISDADFLERFRSYVHHGSEKRVAIVSLPTQNTPGHINGAVILMHIDGYRFHLLEAMVDLVEGAGYQCTTFSQARAAKDWKASEWTLLTPPTAPILSFSQEVANAKPSADPGK
jgi:peptidoglycan/xylan/chitin deacetylase (PgdA/CDA1 family)